MALTKRERKERLRERLGKGAQKEIAKRVELSESTVSQVMNRKTQTLHRETIKKVQAAIADVIGVPVEEAFADAAA